MGPCRLDDCTRFRSYTLADLVANDIGQSASLTRCRLYRCFIGLDLYSPREPLSLHYLKHDGETF
jgi:hypothetical protein